MAWTRAPVTESVPPLTFEREAQTIVPTPHHGFPVLRDLHLGHWYTPKRAPLESVTLKIRTQRHGITLQIKENMALPSVYPEIRV